MIYAHFGLNNSVLQVLESAFTGYAELASLNAFSSPFGTTENSPVF